MNEKKVVYKILAPSQKKVVDLAWKSTFDDIFMSYIS